MHDGYLEASEIVSMRWVRLAQCRCDRYADIVKKTMYYASAWLLELFGTPLGADGDFLAARAHVAQRWYCHLYSKVSRKFLVLEMNFHLWCGRKH